MDMLNYQRVNILTAMFHGEKFPHHFSSGDLRINCQYGELIVDTFLGCQQLVGLVFIQGCAPKIAKLFYNCNN